jgi:hypothetical protein
MNHKQFDLEQGILNCWNICEDMKIVADYVMNTSSIDRDKLANIMIGLSDMYQLKFEKTFSDFEETIKYYYAQRKELQELVGKIEDRHDF